MLTYMLTYMTSTWQCTNPKCHRDGVLRHEQCFAHAGGYAPPYF